LWKYLLAGLILLPVMVAGQDLRQNLFQEADDMRAKARKAGVQYLAPENYQEAMEHYEHAESDFEDGKNLADIRKRLRAAVNYFKRALEAAELARVTLKTAIEARADALDAKAHNFAEEDWKEAEKKFKQAARELEDGDVNDAREKGGEAETLYRQAELGAIKANYLSETWTLLDRAEDEDVEDEAPKTLDRADSLAQRAEAELTENRYDTDFPRSLAREAQIEARHALYLATTIRDLDDKDTSMEEMILWAEDPLDHIAGVLDMQARFDNGLQPVEEQIVSSIRTLQDSLAYQSQVIADRNQLVESLQARIGELENQLGSVAMEQTELKRRMELQAELRERFRQIDDMFAPQDARVLRDGSDVIIRLAGLTFASGKSEIEPRFFGLLTNVQKAIRLFPDARLTIEGHTDSFGGDQVNLRLSQERAEAVRQYLLANMPSLYAESVTAVGRGESFPIANNETAEGRAKNRRIDVIIHAQGANVQAGDSEN
jgi:outer membrane protein OmpA-like peptidoglycan-associated protein